jgi:hypothetical protein
VFGNSLIVLYSTFSVLQMNEIRLAISAGFKNLFGALFGLVRCIGVSILPG